MEMKLNLLQVPSGKTFEVERQNEGVVSAIYRETSVTLGFLSL